MYIVIYCTNTDKDKKIESITLTRLVSCRSLWCC